MSDHGPSKEFEGGPLIFLGSIANASLSNSTFNNVHVENIRTEFVGLIEITNTTFSNLGSIPQQPLLVLKASKAKLNGVVMKDSTVMNQKINGAAIQAFQNSDLVITNSEFRDLKAFRGGAIFIDSVDELTIESSKFINTQAFEGGALMVKKVTNGHLTDN